MKLSNKIILITLICGFFFQTTITPTAFSEINPSQTQIKQPQTETQLLWKKMIDCANILNIHPNTILIALAQVESGGNPWAIHLATQNINLESVFKQFQIPFKGYRENKKNHYAVYPKNKEQARIIISWAKNKKDVNFDSGLMQINKKNIKIDPVETLDTSVNIALGGLIFKACLEKEKNLWYAVECYHRGHSGERVTNYSFKVAAKMARLASLPE